MQILSPLQVKDTKAAEIAAQGRAFADISIKVANKAQELNDLGVKFEAEKKKKSEEIAELDAEIVAKRGILKGIAEERARMEAPIAETKKQWEEKVAEVDETIKKLDQDRAILDEERGLVISRQITLDEREEKLDERNLSLDKREEGIAREEKRIAESTRALNIRTTEVSTKINAANEAFAVREDILQQQEYGLKVRTEALDRDKAEFLKESHATRRELADQRATLERAMKRIKK